MMAEGQYQFGIWRIWRNCRSRTPFTTDSSIRKGGRGLTGSPNITAREGNIGTLSLKELRSVTGREGNNPDPIDYRYQFGIWKVWRIFRSRNPLC